MVYMKIKEKTARFIDNHPIARAIFTDRSNKAVFFTALKLFSDFVLLAIQVVALILSPSLWYATLAVLYLTYLLTKLSIVITRVKRGTALDVQQRVFRNTGILLLLTVVPFVGSIVLIYTTKMTFNYAGMLIFANAAWTFFRIISAAVRIVKDRREDLYLQAVRGVNTATALISVATLQVAMLHAFDSSPGTTPFNAITGGVVGALIVALAVYMIVRGSRQNKGDIAL